MKNRYFIFLFSIIILLIIYGCRLLVSDFSIYDNDEDSNFKKNHTSFSSYPVISNLNVSGINSVNCLYADSTNDFLYIGTDKGLYFVNMSVFSSITPAADSAYDVKAVYANGNAIYFGAASNGLFTYNGSSIPVSNISDWTNVPSLSGKNITGIYTGLSDIYVSDHTDDNGLHIADNFLNFTGFDINSSVSSKFCTGVTGNNSGYVYVWDNNNLYQLHNNTDLTSDPIQNITDVKCSGSYVAVCTSNPVSEIIFSEDNMTNYTFMSTPAKFKKLSISGSRIYFIGDDGGFFYTDNSGDDWNGPYLSSSIFTNIFAAGSVLYLSNQTAVTKAR